MKKLFYLLSIGALTASIISCSDKSKNEYVDDNGNPRNYSLEGEAPTKYEKALGDTFSFVLGEDMGSHLKSQIKYQMQNRPEAASINIEKFIKGMESVIYADTTEALSYIIGQSFALQQIVNVEMKLKENNIPFNGKLLVNGFRKAYNDTTASNYQSKVRDLQTMINILEERKDSVKRSVQKIENLQKGTAFLDSVKKADPEVKTSESGLSYKILEAGSDKMVNHDGKVKLNYKGSKINGEVFDETKGQPREFPVSGFIPGFVEGIEMLGEGGKAILYIPGELGYGERGVPHINVGPDETLVFEVEVVEVIEQDPAAPAKK